MTSDELNAESVPEISPATPEPSELEALRAALTERDLALAANAEANRAILDRVRSALLASEPAVLPELVTGDTLEEVEASFAAALAMVHRVRDAATREQSTPVPAGAPGRTPPQSRSSFEKIRSGLGHLTR